MILLVARITFENVLLMHEVILQKKTKVKVILILPFEDEIRSLTSFDSG